MSADARAASAIWDDSGWVAHYETHRSTTGEMYPSEWFFLKDLLREGMTVLDIGCAAGGLASVLDEHIRTFGYTGVDVSARMVERARQRHPEREFHVIDEADLSALGGRRFDLVVCLGVLHLSRLWRDVVARAWSCVRGTLLLDLRQSAHATVEDPGVSHFRVGYLLGDVDSTAVLPYNIINAAEALGALLDLCPGAARMQQYGYIGAPTAAAVTPFSRILMSTYRIDKE